ncbi:helix-turn-helix domain-containing protein [Planktotalea sp.]|uniref:helix-turn-helix domain-containing protein n=1 Tax=Planktotalea sp. TaxID=2029877 RepID=UPI003D6BBD6F
MADWREQLEKALNSQGSDFKITEFSSSLGFSRDFVSRMLKSNSNPAIGNLQKVCDGLNISIVYLFTGKETSELHDDVARRMTEMSKTELLKLRNHITDDTIIRFEKDGASDPVS